MFRPRAQHEPGAKPAPPASGDQMKIGSELVILCALIASGCGEDDGTIVLSDQGVLCVYGAAPSLTAAPWLEPELLALDEGLPLVVSVALDECLSSSCDLERSAECSVARDGQTLTVSSRLAYRPNDAPACTMDCGRLTAVCESEALEAGSYTVELGNQSHALAVPSTLGRSCL